MAKQTTQPAKGNSGDTAGPVKTPAPTKPPRVRFSDDFGGKGDLNYGRNRQNLPASVEPGATVESDLAKDLRTTVGDDALSYVQQHGTSKQDVSVTGQLRDIAAKAQPTTFGMKDPNANPAKVPSGANGIGGNNSAFAAELAAKQHGKK